MFCCTGFWLLRSFRFCLSTPTRWGWHKALSYNLSSPLIHFFFLLVKKENEQLNFNCCQGCNTKQQYLQIFLWLRWLCSESLGWRFNPPYSRKAGWSLNIHMRVLPWREDWGHRRAEYSIFANNSTQQDKWNSVELLSPHQKKKKISSRAEETAGRKKRDLYFSNRNGGWHLGIWQRMVKKPSSQQNTMKRFISLERVILEWDMIRAGSGLSQTILGGKTVIASTT